MDLRGKKVILVSGSPRRRELLGGLDIPFEVDTDYDFDEDYELPIPREKITQFMSRMKNYGVRRPLEPGEILISSDTMVFIDNLIMGKPHTREEAVDMLRKLSGRTHEVITAVTVRDISHEETITDTTKVTFRTITQEEIDYYIDTYHPFDKAGAYGIQEWIGYTACTGIEGSYYNVMGFPVNKVYEELVKFAGYE